MSDSKESLDQYLTYIAGSMGLGWSLEREYKFHPTRKWRFDFCWPEGRVAVEYDGIMKRTVGHNSLAGILRDSEKINHAQALGWQVYRANAKTVEDGTFFSLIDNVLIERARAGE